jgi:hypothetical protein
MAEREIYRPPTDPDAPLDGVEAALVRMFVKILVREVRGGAGWWTDDADDTETASRDASRPRPLIDTRA